MRKFPALLLAASWLLACSDAGPQSQAVATTGGGGSGGGALGGGGTVEQGCPAGSDVVTCAPAGVPVDGCGEGFGHGGEGCSPVLPAAACADGEIAILGESRCQPLRDCGAAPFGNAPAAAAVFVDQTFAGVPDGGALAPYPTLTAAYAAAPAGSVIAIAAGSYDEALTLDKAVTLWGRCPSLVTLTNAEDVLVVEAEVHVSGVTMVSPKRGASASTVVTLTFEDTHFKTDAAAVALVAPGAGSTLLMRRVVSDNVQDAVLARGSSVELDQVLARGSGAPESVGIDLGFNGTSNTLRIKRSHIHDFETAVGLVATDAEIDSTLVATARPSPHSGIALIAPEVGIPSSLLLTGSVVDGAFHFGVGADGGDMAIVRSVVRGSHSSAIKCKSDGVYQGDLDVVDSLVEGVARDAVRSQACNARVERSVLRDVRALSTTNRGGYGVALIGVSELPVAQLGSLVMHDSVVAGTQEIAVLGFAGHLEVHHSVVRDTLALPDGSFGDGITVVPFIGVAASADIAASQIEGNARAGIGNFGGTVRVAGNDLRCNAFALHGGSAAGGEYTYENEGGNRCGCEVEGTCVVSNANLAVPVPAAD